MSHFVSLPYGNRPVADQMLLSVKLVALRLRQYFVSILFEKDCVLVSTLFLSLFRAFGIFEDRKAKYRSPPEAVRIRTFSFFFLGSIKIYRTSRNDENRTILIFTLFSEPN